MTFSNYKVQHGGCWSKLRRQVYTILEPELNLQLYCTFYISDRDYKAGPFTSPRHWITLEKEIIWDFPSYFLEWKHPNVPKTLKYLESGHGLWGDFGSAPAQLMLEYLSTPVNQLLARVFSLDYWGLMNILRAGDRRIGQRRLRAFAEQLSPTEPAMKVIRRRFSMIRRG
jgi:hypothetical protein